MTYPIVSRGLCCNCAQSILNISRASVVPLHRQYLSPVQKSQQRFASILSSLSDNPSAYHKAKRLGRGPSSGKGKTSGRGHKGQKQHGKVPSGFEGGQTPIEVVHGKYGFKNVFSVDLTTLPISRIQSWIAQGRISPDRPITVRELVRSNCISMPKDGVKLLATSFSHQNSIDIQPPLSQPLQIVVSRASASAIAAVEKAGGKVTTRYYTRWAIRKIVEGKMDPMTSLRTEPNAFLPTPSSSPEILEQETTDAEASTEPSTLEGASGQYSIRLPDAISRKAIEYYRDPAHRGYLAYTVEEGRGPSLYHKPPYEEGAKKRAAMARSRRKIEENRVW